MQYAYVSAQEALAASSLEVEPYRTGIVMSTALAGLAATERTQRKLSEQGTRVGPKFLTPHPGEPRGRSVRHLPSDSGAQSHRQHRLRLGQ